MNNQSSLWDQREEFPDLDVTVFKNYFDPVEALSLFKLLHETVPWEQESIKMFGKETPIPRMTAWFGDPEKTYTYSGILNQPHDWALLPELEAMREKLNQTCTTSFNSVLLNLYRDGNDSVDWHADDERELGPEPMIASVSLGETRKFDFRSKHDSKLKRSVELFSGDIVVMSGLTQQYWEHRVPKTAEKIRKSTGPRINLTFRTIYSTDDPIFNIA
jgi:alkylated DNA repair dioxygenase AlkB